jgi:hypothetical protein
MKLKKIKPIKNKKAQFESMLLAVVLIVIVGIILFFMNHVNDQLYSSLDDYFNSTSDFNESEARDAVQTIQTVDNAVWDFAFLAIFIGLMLQMLLLSFATRINVAFFWIFVVLGVIIVIVGVILSNMWMEIVIQPEFAETILRFPITNALLGTYFPTVIVTILFLGMIILFGKPPTRNP